MRPALLCLFLFYSFFATAQVKKLQLASDIWPPFTNVAGEKAFAIDLVKEALARKDIKIQVEIAQFTNVMNGIKKGEFDGSAALWESDERKQHLVFSAPYLQNQLILVGRKGSDVSAESFPDLNGKRVAVVETYAYGTFDDKNGISLVYGKSDQENLELLLKNEADYMLVDALLIQYLMKHQKDELSDNLEIGTRPLLRKSLHFAIRKDYPDAAEIIDQFNKEIMEMLAEGTYNRILQINWIRADIDGDGQAELIFEGEQAGEEAPTGGYDVFLQASTVGTNYDNQHFYIDGNKYPDWQSVPPQYKVSPREEPVEDVKILKFRF
jgi:ABC-type amino acid transport substrate-binding protein